MLAQNVMRCGVVEYSTVKNGDAYCVSKRTIDIKIEWEAEKKREENKTKGEEKKEEKRRTD